MKHQYCHCSTAVSPPQSRGVTEAAATTGASAHTEQFGGDVQIIDIFDNFQDNLYFRHFPPSTLHLTKDC